MTKKILHKHCSDNINEFPCHAEINDWITRIYGNSKIEFKCDFCKQPININDEICCQTNGSTIYDKIYDKEYWEGTFI